MEEVEFVGVVGNEVLMVEFGCVGVGWVEVEEVRVLGELGEEVVC